MDTMVTVNSGKTDTETDIVICMHYTAPLAHTEDLEGKSQTSRKSSNFILTDYLLLQVWSLWIKDIFTHFHQHSSCIRCQTQILILNSY